MKEQMLIKAGVQILKEPLGPIFCGGYHTYGSMSRKVWLCARFLEQALHLSTAV